MATLNETLLHSGVSNTAVSLSPGVGTAVTVPRQWGAEAADGVRLRAAAP